MTLELTADGLNTQTQEEIFDELAARVRAVLGANMRVDAKSVLGQLLNIVAELRADDQQALLAVVRSFDPSGAIGTALDARLALTGSTRDGATKSSVTGTLTFSAAGTMNNGDQVKNDDNDTIWELTDGPHTSAGPWPETIAATMQAVDTGPILANAGTTWSAVTVVANLDGFTNPTDDAEVGADQQSDADARQKRTRELYSQGMGPLAAIQSAVSKVDNVLTVRVYHNPSTSPVDGDGLPFKAFNVVVETTPSTPTSATQQAIWNAIWSVMGAGGEAYGTDYVGTVTDSEGTAQPVAFDVVTEADIVLEVDLVTSTSEDAVSPNIEAVVAAELLSMAQANHEVAGRDVRALDYEGIVYAMQAAGTISGVVDVTVRMAISPSSPTAVAKLAISIRQKPDFDSANITVAQT